MLWSSLGPMGTHRHGLGVAILEGPLYAVGGHDGWSYLNTVERLKRQKKNRYAVKKIQKISDSIR